jgi:pyruvate,water dikinase
MADILFYHEIGPGDRLRVGGKALGIARLANAGLPVPPGFSLTADVYRRLAGRSPGTDLALREAILQAYAMLSEGAVVVRSSATEEDTQAASHAGQYLTVLNVQDQDALLDAIQRCWASLDSASAAAYRRQQGTSAEDLAMAVIVQRLAPAKVSGVLFTRDPLAPDGESMRVEAAAGLGEEVVSGRTVPERYRLQHASGSILDQAAPNSPCLDEQQLVELAELGRQVEVLFGTPQDVEWAWADGQFWLLQSRPITADATAREEVRREEIAALAARSAPAGTVWSRCNLAEVLPEPTPMTWATVRYLLSGVNRLGRVYRDLGLLPDRAVAAEGVYDLVCGRPYCNLSREPLLYASGLPLEIPFASLKAAPERALQPRAVINFARAPWDFWLRLPVVLFRLARARRRLSSLRRTLVGRLRKEVFPEFARVVAQAATEDLTRLEPAQLHAQLVEWVRRTCADFAREGLKPAILAATATAALEEGLQPALGPDRTRAVLTELLTGVRPDPEADWVAALRDLTAGRLDRADFLKRFGHRGSREMELAEPRWAEDPTALPCLPAPASAGREANIEESWERTAAEAHLTLARRRALEEELRMARTYLGLRETAKHYFLMGYARIRACLLALDRRFDLDGGIFFLTPVEIPELCEGKVPSDRIAARRRRRALALGLEVPPVLFSDDLDAIGRTLPVPTGETLTGIPLSPGVAEAPAFVLQELTAPTIPAGSYVLVCPTTDPAWVPLLVHARGLIAETGGILSHGAVVAREFGVPAVAGIAGLTQRLKTGQPVRIDGSTGSVTLLHGEER